MILKIIFEDESLLVIDKPAGLVVTPAESAKEKTLSEILQDQYGISVERGGLIHRLDKDTSGVILVAKDAKTLEKMQGQFKERSIQKEYLALVHGQIEKGGKIEGNIGRNPVKREKFTVLDMEGKEAVTEYEVLKHLSFDDNHLTKIFEDFNKIQMRKLTRMNYGKFTLLNCHPLTGRTHQIRVHLKYIGHPIVCDEVYVGRKMYRLDKRWCTRQFLHAMKIGFFHPISGSWMELECLLPEDLKNSLDYLTEKDM